MSKDKASVVQLEESYNLVVFHGYEQVKRDIQIEEEKAARIKTEQLEG